jgi:hypothetical protein
LSTTLAGLLVEKRPHIVTRWTDLIFETYPPEASKLMRSKKNQISNPLGATIEEGAEKLFGWLVEGDQADLKDLCRLLDNIVRIRAVQEFSASHSIGFVFLLKTAIRSVLNTEIRRHQLFEELSEFERRIDDLALLAFDNYSQCREQIHEIRLMEVRSRTSRLLERACQKYGMPSEW